MNKLYTPAQFKVLSADPGNNPPSGQVYVYPLSNNLYLKYSDGSVIALGSTPTVRYISAFKYNGSGYAIQTASMQKLAFGTNIDILRSTNFSYDSVESVFKTTNAGTYIITATLALFQTSSSNPLIRINTSDGVAIPESEIFTLSGAAEATITGIYYITGIKNIWLEINTFNEAMTWCKASITIHKIS